MEIHGLYVIIPGLYPPVIKHGWKILYKGLHFWEDQQWWMFQEAMFDYERVSTVLIHVLAVIYFYFLTGW